MVLRAVIFDFGGVLVRTRDQRLRTAWETRLGLTQGQTSEIVFGGEMGRTAQLGKISYASYWKWIQAQLALDDASLERFRTDFFAEDFLDHDLMAHIDRLRSRYIVGLLSNATMDGRRLFTEKYAIIEHFDSVTISAEEGVMKPDERIYRIALARAGAMPAETLFVDDTLENVAAAHDLGMQALHFVDPTAAYRELTERTGVC